MPRDWTRCSRRCVTRAFPSSGPRCGTARSFSPSSPPPPTCPSGGVSSWRPAATGCGAVAALGLLLRSRLLLYPRRQRPRLRQQPLSPVAHPQAGHLARPVRQLRLCRVRPVHRVVPGGHRHHRGGRCAAGGSIGCRCPGRCPMSGVTAEELGENAFLRDMTDHHLAVLSRACWEARSGPGTGSSRKAARPTGSGCCAAAGSLLTCMRPTAAGSSSRRWARVISWACPGWSRPTNGSSARQPFRTL